MTTSVLGSKRFNLRKNDRRISFISHDLTATDTLATPRFNLLTGSHP